MFTNVSVAGNKNKNWNIKQNIGEKMRFSLKERTEGRQKRSQQAKLNNNILY